ncbi:MAG: hypothetical protein HY336_00320 [Candidatus Doudnabacteria bacterium]|nr:hypothetical protein [Candidatus Doudnabacteria bacterium]
MPPEGEAMADGAQADRRVVEQARLARVANDAISRSRGRRGLADEDCREDDRPGSCGRSCPCRRGRSIQPFPDPDPFAD